MEAFRIQIDLRVLTLVLGMCLAPIRGRADCLDLKLKAEALKNRRRDLIAETSRVEGGIFSHSKFNKEMRGDFSILNELSGRKRYVVSELKMIKRRIKVDCTAK